MMRQGAADRREYGRENNSRPFMLFDPVRRHVFSALPLSVMHHLSLYLTVGRWLIVHLGITPNGYFKLLRNMPFGQMRNISWPASGRKPS